MLGFVFRRTTLFILLAICLIIFWARMGVFSGGNYGQVTSWSWSGFQKNNINLTVNNLIPARLHTASMMLQGYQYQHKEATMDTDRQLVLTSSTSGRSRVTVPTSASHTPTRHVGRSDLVIRSAFIDSRVRDGHENSTVIFAEVSKEFRRYELTVGCGVDGQEAKEYRVHTLYWDWIDYRYPKLTHEEVMIVCYDVPAYNGSTAFIRYRLGPNSTVVNEKSVVIVSTSNWGGQKDTVVICTTCYGKPPWLSEWLRYQITLGVDLVQLYAEEEFSGDSQNMETIQTYVEEGFLKIEYRKTYFNSTQIYYHSQTLNYNDCLYRHQNTHQYAMFVDTDDFFVPRLHNKTGLTYYLHNYIKGHKAAVRFHWHKFFPDCGLLQAPDSIRDGNITSILKSKEFVENVNAAKFVCRSSATTQVTVHKPLRLLEGYHEAHIVDSNEAYVAHIRLHQGRRLPCRKHSIQW